ncbi:putative glycoside hydrolase [Spirochaeta isovalerica]|uniref:DUF4015 domain-containing protein n=1 Tax=Spirochaeta isovalerica TaxID=150 RepID=A0A841RBQ3_9SPIO|nr:putative glycoside hydrolase [Spirochaeta isovalerica]MBB6480791.1 hypothetical protein [Spirochaeta isovalerica]
MKKSAFFVILIAMAGIPLFSATGNINSRPDIIKEVGPDLHYGVSLRNGFLKSEDGGRSWVGYNEGLPPRMVYPFTGSGVKMLTSVTYDVNDPRRVLVSSPRELFLSENGGDSWSEVSLSYPFKYSNYITSLALNPLDNRSIVVGTSFSGIFETADSGQTWTRISDVIPELYRGAGFYEEITAVALSPYDNGVLYYLCGPTGELYFSDTDRRTWINIDLPFGKEERALSMNFIRSDDNDTPGSPAYILQINTDKASWVYNPGRNWWWRKDMPLPADYSPDPGKMFRLEKASGKYGIYISSWHASGERLDKHLQFVIDKKMNSIIVDMKDDDGYLTYDSRFSSALETGAVTPRFSIEELLQKAHEKGIYVIARLPVFKDSVLYRYDEGRYALKDKNTGGTWGKLFKNEDEETGEITWDQREFWVDPYSEFVWEYNVGIAEELQELGVDEIQFDYIRFPTDGDLSAIQYSFARPGMLRIEALESFLVMAREKIHIPISTDLYGFNSWYRMGNWNGQNIEMVSHYVDVISPMYYPSHFPGEFLSDLSYLDRAEEIYREGSRRSSLLAGQRSLIRPYVQAFLMGPELKMEDEEYTMYLNRQIKGTEESATSGFSLWNASNRYYMVSDSFTDYFR